LPTRFPKYTAKGDEIYPRAPTALEQPLLVPRQQMGVNQGVARIGPGRVARKQALEAKLVDP
jgi:hypothetical protein